MNYPLEKHGNWIKSNEFNPPKNHIMARFESSFDRVALYKCSVNCPIHRKKPCKRHIDTINHSPNDMYNKKDNVYFCAFHLDIDSKGKHQPITMDIP